MEIYKEFRPSLDLVVFTLLTGLSLTQKSVIEVPQTIPDRIVLTPLAIILILAYWLVEYQGRGQVEPKRYIALLKWALIMCAIVLTTIGSSALAIWLRNLSAPHLFVHDGLIQSEVATSFLLEGRNPYLENYLDSSMARWPFQEEGLVLNPALFHYPYMPLTFMLPVPVQTLAENGSVWSDHRILYLLAFVLLLMVSVSLTTSTRRRLLMLACLGLNPLFVPFLIEGRNDILTLFWLALTVMFVQRRHYVVAACCLGAACGTKQLSWFFVPFFFAYISEEGNFEARLRNIVAPLVAYTVVFVLIVLPWLIWSPAAFFEDVIAFQSGMTTNGYPIKGVGFSSILRSTGFIDSNLAQFPFWIFQLIVGLPSLAFLLARQFREPDLQMALFGYISVLFIVLFFSRAFNDNYLGFLSMVLILAAFSDSVRISDGQTVPQAEFKQNLRGVQ